MDSGPVRSAQLSGKEEAGGSPCNERVCLEARLVLLHAGEKTERGSEWAWGKRLSKRAPSTRAPRRLPPGKLGVGSEANQPGETRPVQPFWWQLSRGLRCSEREVGIESTSSGGRRELPFSV